MALGSWRWTRSMERQKRPNSSSRRPMLSRWAAEPMLSQCCPTDLCLCCHHDSLVSCCIQAFCSLFVLSVVFATWLSYFIARYCDIVAVACCVALSLWFCVLPVSPLVSRAGDCSYWRPEAGRSSWSLKMVSNRCVFCWPSVTRIFQYLAVLQHVVHTNIYIYTAGVYILLWCGIQLHPKSEPEIAQRSQHDFTAINSCWQVSTW